MTTTLAEFKTGYLDRALDDLEGVIGLAANELADVNFDTLVGTGLSGALVVPSLALAMGKQFVIVRKPNDGSHHNGALVGHLGQRWIFLDDLVASGVTFKRVRNAINDASGAALVTTLHVGKYLYGGLAPERRFRPLNSEGV